ncbi:hypothetical protein EON65_57310 [archaeon]|nr:MAG: hypothetical protein EON65_57310 [archaeon]
MLTQGIYLDVATQQSIKSSIMFSRLQVLVYYYLLRITGKVIAWFAHLPLPSVLSKYILKVYAYFINARLYEIHKPIENFRSISEFFTREIHPRTIGLTVLTKVFRAIWGQWGQGEFVCNFIYTTCIYYL